MAKYIEWDEAVRKAFDACIKVVGHGITQFDAIDIAEEMESIPAADVVEARYDEWETTDVTQEWDKIQKFGHFHNNPNCKFFYSDEDPNGHDYCPHCGAKMDGGKE